MVRRLPDPNPVPTSQHAGNTTADNSAAMTAPGSPSQSVPENMIAPVPQVVPSGPEIPVPNTRQSAEGIPDSGGVWRYTPSAGVETR